MYSNTAFVPNVKPEPVPLFNVGGVSEPAPEVSANVELQEEESIPSLYEQRMAYSAQQDFFNGIYNWANSKRDAECAKEAARVFGDNLADPDNKSLSSLYVGNALLSRSAHANNPAAYIKARGWQMPVGYGDVTNLVRMIGEKHMGEMQSLYDTRKKAIEETNKDIKDTYEALPSLIAASIRSRGGEKGTPLSPELLEKLTKYGMREGAIKAQQRAGLAWMYMSALMGSVDSMQETGREKLMNIANVLSDEKGNLDPQAMAALMLMVDQKATEMQSADPQFWANFVDGFQNFYNRSLDQQNKRKATTGGWAYSSWRDAQGIMPERKPEYNDARVEKLYGLMNQAISTAMTPSEKAAWYAKVLSEMGTLMGDSAVPMAAGMAAAALSGGGGLLLSAGAGWGAGFAVSVDSSINQSIGEAYLSGKINPELYGTLEGAGQAAAENVGGIGTSLPFFARAASRITNSLAARTAGSRFLANKYARTTLNYLTTGAFETATELAEEEIGGMIGTSLNAIARSMGIELSPQMYEFGKALGCMKDYEIAAMFGYSYALGLLGVAANYRAARDFASNTDNLLKAGHSPAAVRKIQAENITRSEKLSEIYANSSLSAEEKQQRAAEVDNKFGDFLRDIYKTDVQDADPEQVRQRLEKEGKKTLSKAELATIIQHGIDIRIFKKAGIIDATPTADGKYSVTLIEKGEEKEDGTTTPDKFVTQEWTRNQLTNYLQMEKLGILESNLRRFQGLVKAHAAAETVTIDGLKIEFQNMREIPLGAYESLRKHNGMTSEFFSELASIARSLIGQMVSNGMTEQEARQQPSQILKGISLGDAANLDTAAEERKAQELNSDMGEKKGITVSQSVEYGGMNFLRPDGSVLVAYVSGRSDVNDILEELLEGHINHLLSTSVITEEQLASFLKEVNRHLPDNPILRKDKTSYSRSDLIEAYSDLALAHYIYNEENLPVSAGGHELLRNIGKAIDAARVLKSLGDAYHSFMKTDEGKAYLANGGKDIADIMHDAGFSLGSILANAQATAQQEIDVAAARDYKPDLEAAIDSLYTDAEAETQLADANAKQAEEPTVIPAEESITGEDIVVTPEEEAAIQRSGEPEITLPLDDAAPLRDLISKGKATTKDFAEFFRKHPDISEAQATEMGILPLSQNGSPASAYKQGKLLAATLSDTQYSRYIKGNIKKKELKKILNSKANFSIKPAESPLDTLQELIDYDDATTPLVELNAVTLKDAGARAYMAKKFKEQVTKELEEKGELSKQEIQEAADNMFKRFIGAVDSISRIAMGIAKEGDKDGAFSAFIEWNESRTSLLKEYENGNKILRSVLKKNGDYLFNIDLGTLCTKREALDYVMEHLFTTDGLSNVGSSTIPRIKQLLREYKFSVACDICFVEARRARLPQDSIKLAFYWKSTLVAAGINDNLMVGERVNELSPEQIQRLEEMADTKKYVEAFNKYMPEDRQRKYYIDEKGNRVAEDYGITADMQRKIAKLFLKNQSLAGILNPGMLMHSAGVDKLISMGVGADVLSFLAGAFGSATGKPLEGFYSYEHETFSTFDRTALARNIDEVYAIGGGRAQSFTDFNPLLFIDYVQLLSDLEARRLPMHMYTKVPALVELFGRSGLMINMSLVPEVVDGVDADHVGLKKNEKGEWEYAWHPDSFPFDRTKKFSAFNLRKRKSFGGRVGIIAVGLSDEHIRMMLRDPEIDMVIPYHKSGLPVDVQMITGLNFATDYTNVQTTRHKNKNDTSDIKPFSFNEVHRHLVNDKLRLAADAKREAAGQEKSIATQYLERMKAAGYKRDARGAAAIYLMWCEDNAYIPKFDAFVNEKNYYKLLEDFRSYNQGNKPLIQGAVRVKLAHNWRKVLASSLKYRETVKNQYGIISGSEQFANEHAEFTERLQEIVKYAPVDGDMRKVFVERLESALGKDNVQILQQEEFYDMLEAKWTQDKGAEYAARHMKVFRNSESVVYGFKSEGTIYLNAFTFNANTPAHEFTHVWAEVLRKSGKNGENLWNQGVNLLKQTEEWKEVLADGEYADIAENDNAIASETLARIVGKLNEEYIWDVVINPDRKPLKEQGIINRIIKWLQVAWKTIRDTFDPVDSKTPLTLHEFSRMPLRDLWDATRHSTFQQYAAKAYSRSLAQEQAEANEIKAAMDADANFSIKPAESPVERFSVDERGSRMLKLIRRERKRYANIIGDDDTTKQEAVNALTQAESIIMAVDKYLHQDNKPVSRKNRNKLTALRNIVKQYSRIIATGSPRSFTHLSAEEQKLMDAIVIDALNDEAANPLNAEEDPDIEAKARENVLPQLYKKHAKILLAEISASKYQTPAEVTAEIKSLEIPSRKGSAFARKRIPELRKQDEKARNEFERNKRKNINALGVIIERGEISDRSALDDPERHHLVDMVETDLIENGHLDKEIKKLSQKRAQEKAEKERESFQKMLRDAAKGRVNEVVVSMLDVAADALDDYLKHLLDQKIYKAVKAVKIKRIPSGRLKGKMTAQTYRDLERVAGMMEYSERQLDDMRGEIEAAETLLNTAIEKGESNLISGNELLKSLASDLQRNNEEADMANLSIALSDYKNDIEVYACLDSKNYEQTIRLAASLYELIQNGRSQWKRKARIREEEIQQFLQHFLSTTTSDMGRENSIREAKEKAKKLFSGDFLNKTMNSAQLFLVLSSYEPLRPLFNHLLYKMTSAQDAREKHLKSIRVAELAAFARIIGIAPKNDSIGYTQKELDKISDEFDKFYVENNKTEQTDIEVSWMPANATEHKKEKLKLTKWEALGLILSYRQKHYKENAELHGFNNKVMEALENHVGSRMMAFGNAIQQILINDGTMPVYEEREGVPLRDNPLYFPVKVAHNISQEPDAQPLTNPFVPASSHNFLKSRVHHWKQLAAANAYLTYRSAVADRANYVFLDPVTAPIESLLARDEFANRLITLIGASMTNQLKATIKEIKGAAHQETSLQDLPSDDKIAKGLSSAALSVLAWNPTSIARQFSAIANAGLMPGIRPLDLLKYQSLVRSAKVKMSVTEVMKLDCFAVRRRDNAYVNELAAMGNDAKYSTLLNWAKAGMNTMDKADALANAVSAAIVYNHKYDQLAATGDYTESQMRQRAEAEVSKYLRLLAQPLNRVDKSALYWQLSANAYGRAMLYMGSEAINKIGMARANYIINRNSGKGVAHSAGRVLAKMGLSVGLVGGAINALIALLTGSTPDDDDSWTAWVLQHYVYGTFGQYVGAMPVLGLFTDAYFSPYAFYNDSAEIPGLDTLARGSKLYTMLTDDKEYSGAQWQKEISRFSRELTALSGLAGGAYAKWQWFSHVNAALHTLTAALNLVYPVSQGVDSHFDIDWYSSKKTRRNRRFKSKFEDNIESIIELIEDTP